MDARGNGNANINENYYLLTGTFQDVYAVKFLPETS
jgi:hypothetical protein